MNLYEMINEHKDVLALVVAPSEQAARRKATDDHSSWGGARIRVHTANVDVSGFIKFVALQDPVFRCWDDLAYWALDCAARQGGWRVRARVKCRRRRIPMARAVRKYGLAS